VLAPGEGSGVEGSRDAAKLLAKLCSLAKSLV